MRSLFPSEGDTLGTALLLQYGEPIQVANLVNLLSDSRKLPQLRAR